MLFDSSSDEEPEIQQTRLHRSRGKIFDDDDDDEEEGEAHVEKTKGDDSSSAVDEIVEEIEVEDDSKDSRDPSPSMIELTSQRPPQSILLQSHDDNDMKPSVSKLQTPEKQQPRGTVVKEKPLFNENRDAIGERAKRKELCRAIQQYNIKIQSLEQEIYPSICGKVPDSYGMATTRSGFISELANDQARLSTLISRTSKSVTALKLSLETRSEAPGPSWMESLKTSMESIEQTIATFKAQQRQLYDELTHEEKICNKEVLAFEQKFDAWELEPTVVQPRIVHVRNPLFAAVPSASVPTEVIEFERYVDDHGGLGGGWDDYDHGTFLRLRAKHGVLQFIPMVVEALPTKVEAEIKQHEEWYLKFLSLQEGKRLAIQAWKDAKKQADLEQRQRADEEKAKIEAEAKQKQEIEERKRLAEIRQKKQQAEEWRQQQQEQKQKAEAEDIQRREAEKVAKQKLEDDKRSRVLEKLAVVQKNRERDQREQELRAAEAARAEEARRKAAAIEIQVFHARDQAAQQERVKKELQLKKEQEEKELRIQKLKSTIVVKATRDPSRLLQPTASTRSRAQDDTSSGGRVYIAGPARAVPAWRKGL